MVLCAIQKQKHKTLSESPQGARMVDIWPEGKSILPPQDGPAEVKGAQPTPTASPLQLQPSTDDPGALWLFGLIKETKAKSSHSWLHIEKI